MEDKILTIPAVALRGMTILPGMVAHFDISRDKSLRAVEEAMKGDQKLFIVTQKDTEKEDPQGEDLYEVGLLAVVRQVVKLQKNIMRVLIEGIGRAETYEYTQTDDYMQARVFNHFGYCILCLTSSKDKEPTCVMYMFKEVIKIAIFS